MSEILRIETLDSKAFEQLFRVHYSELTVYARRFLEDVESAEELVQDVFFKFWENRAKFGQIVSVRAYLYQTVRNACINAINQKKTEQKYRNHVSYQLQIDELELTDWLAADELSRKIEECIEKLPPARKNVFILSKIEHLKYKEIAEKLNISVKTVENQIGQALKFLRDELSEFLPFLIFIFLE